MISAAMFRVRVRARPPVETLCGLLSAAATLPLQASGRSTTSPAAQLGDLPVSEIAQIPGIADFLRGALWTVVGAGVAAIAYTAWHFHGQRAELRRREKAAAAEFEASVLVDLLVGANAQTADDTPGGAILPEPSDVPAKPTPTAEADAETGPPPIDVLCQPVLEQLRQAGLLDHIESFVPLPGNSKGAAVLLLRNRKRVLLMSYYETEVFTERELRRYDGIIYVSRNGRGVLVQSIESVIADSFRTR
jgi:hypothetical protein